MISSHNQPPANNSKIKKGRKQGVEGSLQGGNGGTRSGAILGPAPNTMTGGKVSSASKKSFVAASLVSPSKSKTTPHIATEKRVIQVFDDEGNDVTPLPLLPVPRSYGRESRDGVFNFEPPMASNLSSSIGEKSGYGHFSSHASGAMEMTETGEEKDDDASSVTSAGSGEEREDSHLNDSAAPFRRKGEGGFSSSLPSSQQQAHPPTLPTPNVIGKHLTEAEMNTVWDIHLCESEMIWVLDIPSVCVNLDSTEEPVVRAANERYDELKSSKTVVENHVERGMQTFNNVLKTKEVQASLLKQSNGECMANAWSIYDAYANDVVIKNNETLKKETEEVGGGDASKIYFEAGAGGASYGGHSDGSMGMVGTGSQMAMAVGVGSQGGMTATRHITGSMTQSGMEGSYSMTEGMVSSDEPGTSSMSRQPQYQESTGFGGPVNTEALFQQLNKEDLLNSLRIMERVVVGNNYFPKLLSYRTVVDEVEAIVDSTPAPAPPSLSRPATKDTDKSGADPFAANIPSLQFLWSYRCDLTRDRKVSYMAWNKQTEDILAVAYTESTSNTQNSGGLALCWSIKNPEYPERVYRSKVPITAIDFSYSNPNLLAVGFADGRIAIYDVRRKNDSPILDNGTMNGKHRDPVWELKWVEHDRVMGDEQSRGETLVTISTDGRIVQWSIRKGLELTDLMSLKRVSRQSAEAAANSSGSSGSNAAKSGAVASSSSDGVKSSSFISRQSGGLCFDFNKKESNVYLAGTEDGHIHRCSRSYNEQYLFTYFGHTGPVYRVKWSPFLPSAFLSCSADWTLRLWHQDVEEAILKFQSGRDSVTDVAWSPNNGTMFSCVCNDGRIEVWDLQFSVLDPLVYHTVLDRKLTTVLFSSKYPVVLTGDDTGNVNVYKLQRVPFNQDVNHEKQAAELSNIMAAKNQHGQDKSI